MHTVEIRHVALVVSPWLIWGTLAVVAVLIGLYIARRGPRSD
jgi:hypothetical protein